MREFQVVMEVAPEEDGSRVTVTLRGAMKGVLGGLFAKAMRPQVERNNRRTVSRLQSWRAASRPPARPRSRVAWSAASQPPARPRSRGCLERASWPLGGPRGRVAWRVARRPLGRLPAG